MWGWRASHQAPSCWRRPILIHSCDSLFSADCSELLHFYQSLFSSTVGLKSCSNSVHGRIVSHVLRIVSKAFQNAPKMHHFESKSPKIF